MAVIFVGLDTFDLDCTDEAVPQLAIASLNIEGFCERDTVL